MYTIDELIKLKEAGFTADEIMTLTKSEQLTLPIDELPNLENKTPEPIPTPVPEKMDTSDEFKQMLDTFTKNMNEQMEAFKSAIQLSNINRDSTVTHTPTASDVVAQIIRPNGQERKR